MTEREMRKPVFIKLEDVQPATKGHNIIVKVVERKIVLDKRRTNGEGLRIAECLVGDETATALFTARNEQIDQMPEGAVVALRNCKVNMHKNFMRLAVDKWGVIKPVEDVDLPTEKINSKNISAVEYELVNVSK
uniref:Single-stranded DNA binding protein Ssb-like OB fold domain-containing protein n=1 Tax=Rhodosorus marinus TaxID=101924 RepID=A0A7S3EIC6_9RHOD|mmetsp:Transcript_36272/g.145070  ORF Transcript_36272/g.145070 Transcript_36272/m.145070 type:complete len:134 (+) Transcript_36272:422-823(+)